MAHDRYCRCEDCERKELEILRRLAELVGLFRDDQEPGLDRIYRTLREWERFFDGERA